MHTSSYTYHLREGKRAQREVPGADKEKVVIESEQHSESPGPGPAASQPTCPSTVWLVGGRATRTPLEGTAI